MRKSGAVILGFLFVASLLLVTRTSAQADLSLTIQPSKDVKIAPGYQNMGGNGALEVGGGGGWTVFRALAQFDLPSSLSSTTITSAVLSFSYAVPWSSADPVGSTVQACRMTHDWVEGTGMKGTGGYAQDGATWNYYDGANKWTTPGGDYSSTDSATAIWPAPNLWIDFTVTKIVEGWVSETYPNNGFLIKLDDESIGKGGVFGSREIYGGWVPAPKLKITYVQASTGQSGGQWSGLQGYMIVVVIASVSATVAGIVFSRWRRSQGPEITKI